MKTQAKTNTGPEQYPNRPDLQPHGLNFINTQNLLYAFEKTLREVGLKEAMPDRDRLIEVLSGTIDEQLTAIPSEKPRRPSCLVDTVRVKVRVKHRNLEEYGKLKRIKSGYQVKSKFGTTASLHSADLGDALSIEFSPPQFLTGQNLVGPMNMMYVVPRAVLAILERAEIAPKKKEVRLIEEGEMELSRTDVAVHCDCGTYDAARLLLIALRDYMCAISKAFTVYGFGESLYDCMESRDHSFKIYHKGEQWKRYPISERVHRRDTLIAAAQSMVRFEVCLRKPILKRRGLTRVRDWDENMPRVLLEEQIAKLTPLHAVAVQLEGIEKLTELQAARLKLWMLGDKTAFNQNVDVVRKQRKAIRDATGIDIQSPLSIERQRQAIGVAQALLRDGIGYQAVKGEHWEKLVKALPSRTL